jgi:hypothetical protein
MKNLAWVGGLRRLLASHDGGKDRLSAVEGLGLSLVLMGSAVSLTYLWSPIDKRRFPAARLTGSRD